MQQKNTLKQITNNTIFLGALLLFLGACRTSSVPIPQVVEEVQPEKVERKKIDEVIAAIDSLKDVRPSFFYSKIKTTYSDTNQNVSFKTTIRIAKDSALNAVISKASIPVAQAILRPDSVFIANKINNCYIKKSTGFFKESFGVDFNYSNIEELILGLPIAFDTTQRYYLINDNYQYILSSHRKREVKKETKDHLNVPKERKDKDGRKAHDKQREREREHQRERERNRDKKEAENSFIVQYYLNSNMSALNAMFIDSPEDSATIKIQYVNRDTLEQYKIPSKAIITIKTPRNSITVELLYEKTEVNKPSEMVFILPEDYEECGREK